jgi:hypothetical protein
MDQQSNNLIIIWYFGKTNYLIDGYKYGNKIFE